MAKKCTHPDRGHTVHVKCPTCKTTIDIPADKPEWNLDRHCPVCNTVLPFLPEAGEPYRYDLGGE